MVTSEVKMKVKSKVAKFTGDRKIIEVPNAVKDNFIIGEEVTIEKTKSGKITSVSKKPIFDKSKRT